MIKGKYKVNLDVIDKWIEDERVTDIIYSNGELRIETIGMGYQFVSGEIDCKDIEKIVGQLANIEGKNFNSTEALLDGETEIKNVSGQAIGLRFGAIDESLTGSTIALAIRKTPKKNVLNDSLIASSNYLPKKGLELLKVLIDAKANIIIAGETGTGKTELIKYLSDHIRDDERICTIEDTREVHLKHLYNHKDVLGLNTNSRYSFSKLIYASLRQKIDWLIISEVRGGEIKQLLEAMSTGHTTITTIHANSAESIPRRMINMLNMKYEDTSSIESIIYSYVDIGIYIHKKSSNGISRKIYEIVEFYIDEDRLPSINILYQIDGNKVGKFNKITSEKLKRKIFLRDSDIKNISDLL